jgi:ribosomal protein S18 acetylase RimI-like enzyme
MLKIRLATAADCDAIGALISKMAAHYDGLGANVEANAAATMARTTIASQEGTRFLLAWDESGSDSGRKPLPVGIACFVLIRPARSFKALIYLKDLFVSDAHRSHGIGRRLMVELAIYAEQHDVGRIDLRTNTSNTGAQRLYDSLGGVREDKISYGFDPATLKGHA